MRPYLVMSNMRKEDRRIYQLAELDRVVLEGYFSGDRLIRFDVLVPEDGTPGALAVRVRPLTVTPAPVLALAKVRLSRLELFEVKAVSLSDMLLALVEELEILIRAPVALA